MNTKQQGDIGVGTAIAHFINMGWPVSFPLTESLPYDLIVDEDGELKKVQVKTTRHKDAGKFKVEIRTSGGNQSFKTTKAFNPTKVDYLFVLCLDKEEHIKYLFPMTMEFPTQSLTLGPSYDQYKV